jgi:hypothetical protein
MYPIAVALLTGALVRIILAVRFGPLLSQPFSTAFIIVDIGQLANAACVHATNAASV